MKILITGGMGKTAEPLIELLNDNNYEVTVLDISSDNRQKLKGNTKFILGDICDGNAVGNAMAGIDAVIHLAVNINNINDAELTFKTNVYGIYNILSSAQKHGVGKTVLASSAPVHVPDILFEGQQMNHLLGYVCSRDDDFEYDLTKNIQELVVWNFSQTFSMNTMILRLGHIVDGKAKTDLSGASLSDLSYCRGGWVCRYDVARAFLSAVETDYKGFNLLNVIGSYQAAKLFDLEAARYALNFECDENFLDY